MLRHETFLSALKNSEVEVVKGRFSPVQKSCTACGKLYDTHEEKETDVNMASRLIHDAVMGVHDSYYVLPGDSDQVASIKTIRELAPQRETVAVFSVGRHSNELKAVAHQVIQCSWKHFTRNRFPNPIVLPSGAKLSCPAAWLPGSR